MTDQIRVIIADDHTLVREGTRRILEQHADICVVGEAADGIEAVALAGKLLPDVALIDIAMPRLNGIEATHQIKKIASSVAVIILTVHKNDHFITTLLAAGAAGYLLKDIRGSQLVDAVRAVRSGEAALHPAVARKVLERFQHEAAGCRRAPWGELSHRELEVLGLAARGMSNKDIGHELAVSTRTVQLHLTNIFGKLGVASRTEAVVYGLQHGWISLEELP
jgi:two-component system, NarL family, response regulator LiaR